MWRCWLLVWLQSAATMQNIWMDLLQQGPIVKKNYACFYIFFWITNMQANTLSVKRKHNLTFLDGSAFTFLSFFLFCCAITRQPLIVIMKNEAQTRFVAQSNISLNLEMAIKRPFNPNPLHQFIFWHLIFHLCVNSIPGISCTRCVSASEVHVSVVPL